MNAGMSAGVPSGDAPGFGVAKGGVEHETAPPQATDFGTISPRRIQLRRTPGWRKPEDAVIVSRPSRWGNPFSVDNYGRDLAITLYRMTVTGIWSPAPLMHLSDEDYRDAVRERNGFRDRIGGHPWEAARFELADRDLACWCRLDQPCHADVLLEVANS